MTPKERAAMKLALESLELHLNGCGVAIATKIAYDALREALDHSGEVNEMVGCAYCNNPLFAGTKCNNCGRVTLAEQAEQEPVAWRNKDTGSFCTGGFLCKDINKWTPLYAAPVRTKDLTDDEIRAMFNGYVAPEILLMFRAVIAADREKNRA